MSLAIVTSRANLGLSAPLVTIEVHLSKGLPGLCIAGLPEKAVKESKDRVRSALINNGFEFPIKRMVINLAPADLPKEGGRFDLPIALGILAASDQLPKDALSDHEFVGELALTGALKAVRGILPMALAAKSANHTLMIPQENAEEAALVSHLTCFAANHLLQICAHLTRRETLNRVTSDETSVINSSYPDLSEVRGQQHAKRALEIAAAGGHSLLLTGPPGTGKTMLSSRLPGILPDMSDTEAQTTAAVYSVSTQGFDATRWRQRPFRTPHHTASSVALVGGGNPPKPGEISLAHNGVLFLDELPEFNRHVLEALREPLEAGSVNISRASSQAQFPAQFQLIAAMNPCPCGYYGDQHIPCRCGQEQITRYQNRLSGPLLDRIDMNITVPTLPAHFIFQKNDRLEESSQAVKKRVVQARTVQLSRSACTNAMLNSNQIIKYCNITDNDAAFLETAINKLKLSARAYSRVLKLARTIADLDHQKFIARHHVQEALGYRRTTIAQDISA